MSKGMIGYVVVFVLLIAASLITANTEEITPTMAQAQGDLSVGVGTFTTIEKIGALLFKMALGTIITSVLTVAAVQGWKHYKQWERGERARRWNPGPNARWQQGNAAPRTSNLRREDLMLLALMNGRMPSNNVIQPRLKANREPVQDEQPIELDF